MNSTEITKHVNQLLREFSANPECNARPEEEFKMMYDSIHSIVRDAYQHCLTQGNTVEWVALHKRIQVEHEKGYPF